MSKIGKTASLISYLQPSDKAVRLEFCSRYPSTDQADNTSNPFLVMDDSDPLALIYKGRFITDSGTILRDVFIYVQKDRYMGPLSPVTPLRNQDIQTRWIENFWMITSQDSGSNFIKLAGLIDKHGELLPCKPLLLCKKRMIYFHPPCPRCGRELEQCEDDEILTKYGLPAFSSSLRRFLFCPSCYVRDGESQFYVSEHEPEDGPEAFDKLQLIMNFRQLFSESYENIPLPCMGCTHSEECFGPEKLALTRIWSLAFYPFFIHIVPSPTLHSLEFLSLVSGASFEEILDRFSISPDSGRAAQLDSVIKREQTGLPFLTQDQARFLEILFLKMSFLAQLFEFFSPYDLSGLSFSGNLLERAWVELPESDQVLPYFWNFRLRPLGTFGISPFDSDIWYDQGASALFSFAVAWYYVIFSNKVQDISTVWKHLEDIIQSKNITDSGAFIKLAREQGPPWLAPENIFWDPAASKVPDNFYPQWEKALELGWRLIRDLVRGEAKTWSAKGFLKELEAFTRNLKSELFNPPPPSVHPVQEQPAQEDLIQVLEKIIDKWDKKRQEEQAHIEEPEIPKGHTEPEVPASPEPDRSEEIQLQETVILAPGASREKPVKEGPVTTEVQATKGPEIPETVIISGIPPVAEEKSRDTQPSAEKIPSPEHEDKEFEKTLSLLDEELLDLAGGASTEQSTPAREGDQATRQEAEAEEQDIIPETIIITPGKKDT